MIALFMVFAVVIFFWMAFHQNGLTLTYFANEFVTPTVTGVQTMAFDIINLVLVAILVYALFGVFGKNTQKAKTIWGCVGVAVIGALAYKYFHHPAEIGISAPIFQQFNPFYVVALTPVSMAIFGALAKKGKEPSAPRKIAYGMLVAALAYCLMAVASVGLPLPQTEMVDGELVGKHVADVTPNLLISTYLVLTFAELLLSPMGISFVSKVAPPKYKGMMMGGWFVATAIGNQLVVVGGPLWGAVPLWVCWSVFMAVCLIAAVFMFVMMKRLEKVC
jgi:POT family proton-dependent oligopeptide transporter